jgi:uncharacterized protein YbjT (DUF2867 family)
VTTAIEAANPSKVVCLSTIGAQATQPNLLNQLGLLERALGALPSPVCFLRAVWFMENAAWDVAPARDAGVVPSFLQPLDKPVPMVATADIGHLARISHTTECIGAPNQRKLLCENDFQRFAERPDADRV